MHVLPNVSLTSWYMRHNDIRSLFYVYDVDACYIEAGVASPLRIEAILRRCGGKSVSLYSHADRLCRFDESTTF